MHFEHALIEYLNIKQELYQITLIEQEFDILLTFTCYKA